jgi:hypothetical protein
MEVVSEGEEDALRLIGLTERYLNRITLSSLCLCDEGIGFYRRGGS